MSTRQIYPSFHRTLEVIRRDDHTFWIKGNKREKNLTKKVSVFIYNTIIGRYWDISF